jgi:DNA-binding transcriptional regulator PaaX
MGKITKHETLIYGVLFDSKDTWLSNAEITAMLEGVSERTVRKHTAMLTSLGLIEKKDISPAPFYRLSEISRQANLEYALRLEDARQFYGV